MEKRFVIPFVFKGAPNPSVLMKVEIRPVTNENHKAFGLVTIYTDSHFEPLNVRGYLKLEEAEKLVKENGGIPVKSDFDQYNIEHLREIKTELSTEWIEGFNSHQHAN